MTPESDENAAIDDEVIAASDPVTRLPYGVTRYYASLARSDDPSSDPIAAQFIPRAEERTAEPYDTSDPIGDRMYTVAPRLIHHYRDRALVLVNDRCAVYCRHCFRRHFTGSGEGRITATDLDAIRAYLERHTEVQELLLSGGDPLMLADGEFFRVFDALREVREFIMRVCTRLPVVLPSRVTESFARELGRRTPAWVVIHVNHPREITPQFSLAISRLRGAGLSVANQAVLLRGVNDDVETLETLFRALLRNGIKPYYLFQGDLAAGTAHFRTPVERGIELMRELRARLSGLAMPVYAVDLPAGGGKVPVESALVRVEGDAYVFRGHSGREYRYPRES